MISLRDEDVLKAVWYYRYITARDLTNLLFAKSSITHMREILARLCGGDDLQTHQYLCRFTLPSSNGTRERVYVLGAKGRRLLADMGLPATWYFRPHKLKFLSYGYVLHNLILTRTLIAACLWARDHPSVSLLDTRISYELPGKVIPDGWLLFEEQTQEGAYELPVTLEIDRGMEDRHAFRRHVRGRINYIQSGEYRREFKTDLATIAYITTGQTETYRTTRRKAMCHYIMELLTESRLTEWTRVFRVADVEFSTLYDNSLFEADVWYGPGSKQSIRLFQ